MTVSQTQSAAGLLTLTAFRGIGPATAERLAERYALFDAILDSEPEKLRSVVSAAVAESLHAPTALATASEKAQRVLDEADRHGVRVLSIFDTEYPDALRTLSDRPPVLFVKGKLPPRRCVACIGTREPSKFGEFVSDRIVQALVHADWTIVSGLAIGVDTLSHQAALRHGGRTIAVMAGGLDGIYPKQNSRLAQEILEKDGALVSEQAFGVPPSPRNLVQRDRLQSGLSIATFVIQTDIKGGSMHTVRFTIQQNRLLFAPVPQGSHAAEPKSQGILAMTQMSAIQFAEAVQAEREYRRILLEQYNKRPVAVPLAGKEDYTSMLALLESRLESGDGQAASARTTLRTQMTML